MVSSSCSQEEFPNSVKKPTVCSLPSGSGLLNANVVLELRTHKPSFVKENSNRLKKEIAFQIPCITLDYTFCCDKTVFKMSLN